MSTASTMAKYAKVLGQHEPRPVAVHGPTAVGIAIARARRDVSVVVFEPDWAAVDRGRARVEALGLAGRVAVHHRDAAALLGLEGSERPAFRSRLDAA